MVDNSIRKSNNWLQQLVNPSNILQILLVIVTMSGIYFQYKIFDLEKEYKEISVKPVIVINNPKYVAETSIRNIGLGSAEITEISYESDTFAKLQFSLNSLLDENTENRIKIDIRNRALAGASDYSIAGIKLITDVDFMSPGTFIVKDNTWFFARVNMDQLRSDLSSAKKLELFESSASSIRRKIIDNYSTFRIEFCFCSVTRRECKKFSIGSRGTEQITCERWQAQKG